MLHVNQWLYCLMFFCLLINSSSAGTIAPENVQGAQTIDTGTAKSLFDRKIPFIDVRKPEDFMAEHIPGAYHLPIKGGFDKSALRAIAGKEKPVVIYCNGIHCMGSSMAAQQAVEWGWINVYYYRGGIPEWKSNGHPIQRQQP